MSWPVDVYAPPALQGYASATNTDVGRSVYFTAVVTGGAGGGGTLWSFGDDSTGIGANVSHSWTAPGVYNVTATYTDNQSNRASWSTQVYVSLAPAGEFVVTAASAPSPAQPGTLFYYNATLDGGTAPYAVVWHFGDGSEASGLHVTHAYSAAGNYSINVDVTDAAGAPVNATLAVEVVAGPSTTGGSTLNFSLGLLLGLVVGAALAAVLVFVATARRRTKRKSPPPPSPYVPPARQAWKED